MIIFFTITILCTEIDDRIEHADQQNRECDQKKNGIEIVSPDLLRKSNIPHEKARILSKAAPPYQLFFRNQDRT